MSPEQYCRSLPVSLETCLCMHVYIYILCIYIICSPGHGIMNVTANLCVWKARAKQCPKTKEAVRFLDS